MEIIVYFYHMNNEVKVTEGGDHGGKTGVENRLDNSIIT